MAKDSGGHGSNAKGSTITRNTQWRIDGHQGSKPASVMVTAKSHGEARKKAVMQGIGPKNIVMQSKNPGADRRKAITAYKAATSGKR